MTPLPTWGGVNLQLGASQQPPDQPDPFFGPTIHALRQFVPWVRFHGVFFESKMDGHGRHDAHPISNIQVSDELLPVTRN